MKEPRNPGLTPPFTEPDYKLEEGEGFAEPAQPSARESGTQTRFSDTARRVVSPAVAADAPHGSYVTHPFGRRKTDTEPLDPEGKGRRHIPPEIKAAELAAAGVSFHFNRRAQDKPHVSGIPTEPPGEDPFTHPEEYDNT